ncbi:hypothetical protein LCGC14_2755580, partial [marine sediment metagenome]
RGVGRCGICWGNLAIPSLGIKQKDLVSIPPLVAFALQADGWWLRRDIIWAKPSCMPESVTDRPTTAHEYVFLLSKAERYFYDADAIAEPCKPTSDLHLDERGAIGAKGNKDRNDSRQRTRGKHSGQPPQSSGHRMVENVARARAGGGDHDSPFGATRNARSVWTITTKPYPGAHFATFPLELAERCIKAGSPRAHCPSCNAPLHGARLDYAKDSTTVSPSVQVVQEGLQEREAQIDLLQPRMPSKMAGKESTDDDRSMRDDEGICAPLQTWPSNGSEERLRHGASTGDGDGHWPDAQPLRGCAPQERRQERQPSQEPGIDARSRAQSETEAQNGIGDNSVSALRRDVVSDWACDACGREGKWEEAKPSVILDPFGGSGTTARAATDLGRNAIHIDLNPDLSLAIERIGPLLVDVKEVAA